MVFVPTHSRAAMSDSLENTTETGDESAFAPDRSANAESDSKLVRELGACLPLLPVLATQLREVAEQVEQGVVQVCRSFDGMASRARDAVGQIKPEGNVAGAGSPGSDVGQLIVTTRQTMGGLLQRIEQTSLLSTTVVERMEQIEQRIQGLDQTLGMIDTVAAHAHLLALNGQIEAARAGKHGVTFAIVATETSKLAVHALDASKAVRRLMAGLIEQIAAASHELHQRASADTQQAALSRIEVDRALDSMSSIHDRMCRTVLAAQENSERLASDIASAVVAMQFQDSVSQRVEHVITTLEEIHSGLSARMGSPQARREVETASDAGSDEWTGRMAAYYTMASERQALAAHVAGAKPSQDLGDNIELF